MKKLLLLALLLLALLFMACSNSAPRGVNGIDPNDIVPNNGKFTLVDMGYVNGEIQGRKLHCYYVVYGADIGTRIDHIYILEGSDGKLSVQQPEAKTYKSITVITDTDTFRLK